ncbi:MAG TPA: FAD-dependent oxidoreductase [Actinomycetota bacterium]|nr:FAD-dependent oxidoreductase [Actinomycetota bacterium]
MAKVLILGGGFGGLAAAAEIRRLDSDLEVVLVDRRDHFFMGFAKLWDLAGVRPLPGGTVSLHRLADRGVTFVQAEITGIDPSARRVGTSTGTLEGDALLVALGAAMSPAHQDLVGGPGAFNLYDAGQLPTIRQALAGIGGGSVLVAVLGVPLKCPPAPFEATLIVDDLLRQRGVRERVGVSVSTPQPITMPVAGPDASQYVASQLAGRGIELLTHHAVAGVDPVARVVRYANGAELGYDILLGVPAAAPPPVIAESPLAGKSGWVEAHRHSLRTAFERVYAVGDCTVVPTATFPVPKAGVFAAGEGEVAARNIVRDLTGTGDEASYDGEGACFLELPGRAVALVEGRFFAEPEPVVHVSEATAAAFQAKQEFERARLEAWLG